MRILQRARRQIIPKIHNQIALTNYMIEGCSFIEKLREFSESMNRNKIFTFHRDLMESQNEVDKDYLRDELRICIAIGNRVRQEFKMAFDQESAMLSAGKESNFDAKSLAPISDCQSIL